MGGLLRGLIDTAESSSELGAVGCHRIVQFEQELTSCTAFGLVPLAEGVDVLLIVAGQGFEGGVGDASGQQLGGGSQQAVATGYAVF